MITKSNLPSNPIEKIRKDLGFYQNGLSRAADISVSTIYQLEKGMLVNIPDRIHVFFSRRVENYNIAQIEEEYNKWIRNKRKAQKNKVPSFYAIPNIVTELNSKHPLSYYLEYHKINTSKFCDLLCIPKNSFYKFTSGAQETTPKIIIEALEDAGVSFKEISYLDIMSGQYYRYAQDMRIAKRKINVRRVG